jgi:hypothetical protein
VKGKNNRYYDEEEVVDNSKPEIENIISHQVRIGLFNSNFFGCSALSKGI